MEPTSTPSQRSVKFLCRASFCMYLWGRCWTRRINLSSSCEAIHEIYCLKTYKKQILPQFLQRSFYRLSNELGNWDEPIEEKAIMYLVKSWIVFSVLFDKLYFGITIALGRGQWRVVFFYNFKFSNTSTYLFHGNFKIKNFLEKVADSNFYWRWPISFFLLNKHIGIFFLEDNLNC